MNPRLLSVHDHQVILGKNEARENINHDEYEHVSTLQSYMAIINGILPN